LSAPSPALDIPLAIAIVVWLLIAIAVVLRRAITRHRLVAIAMRTALPPLPREVQALARARQRVRLRQSVDLARSALPEAPAVLRVVRPLLVLPIANCDELSEGELESLLCHECAHVARRDNLIDRLESLVCALFWFHPLIWIAQRITAIERERACDEVAAGSADERKTYLAALRKFCHASIAPRLPGVSCMATARLKERIDHVMNYENLRRHAPAPRRVALVAAFALVLFTVTAAFLQTGTALAADAAIAKFPYSIKATATRTDGITTLTVAVHDSERRALTTHSIQLDETRRGAMRIGRLPGPEIVIAVEPGSGSWLKVHVTVNEESVTDRVAFEVVPVEVAKPAPKYTGDPITLSLTNADLRNVIETFGQLTGHAMKIDDDVKGKVSVAWQNVPWDEAFATLLDENGLTYRIEGKTIHVTKK
jgi:beta-lactamase regulating signal transducer with metallopeptidase domain